MTSRGKSVLYIGITIGILLAVVVLIVVVTRPNSEDQQGGQSK